MSIVNCFEEDRPYVESKFRQDVCPPESGLSNEELKERILALIPERDDVDQHSVIKARAFGLICDHVRMDVSERDFFPSFGCWNRYDRPIRPLIQHFAELDWKNRINRDPQWLSRHEEDAGTRIDHLHKDAVTTIWLDFDHSVPEWERMMALGFPGALADVRAHHAACRDITPRQEAFYTAVEMTLEGLLRNMGRLVECARKKNHPRCDFVAAAIEQLMVGAPRNTYEAFMAIYLFFVYGEHFDHMQVRTLGNLDNLLRPFYEADLRNGTFDEGDIRMFADYFFMQYASIDNYWGHPLYFGGTNPDGTTRINPLSYLLLEEFGKLNIPTPKIQLKVSKSTPDSWIDLGLKCIRNGSNSIVFVGEESMKRAMRTYVENEEDMDDFHIRGCYEFGCTGRHHENSTAFGHVNLPRIFHWILQPDKRSGYPYEKELPAVDHCQLDTFEKFFQLYEQFVERLIDIHVELGNMAERGLADINSAHVLSSMVKISLEKGQDAFSTGCYYNNTHMLFAGFATAVDGLMAIKNLVYDSKRLTLAELGRILEENWSTAPELRLEMLYAKEKYGNGICDVDDYAVRLSKIMGNRLRHRANGRGGVWICMVHSARQYMELGKRTGATPDGRLAGEEMSKNASPAMGNDRNGVTALIQSLNRLSTSDVTGGLPLDVMLHPSSVQGDDGLEAWRMLLRVCLENGGHAIQFNIFSPDLLRAAQANPEKYQGLQVRVCGWNVHFIEMSKSEQDFYIRRAEAIA